MKNDFREEKMQILKMVEEGKITIEEGVNLLNALETETTQSTNKSNAKWLKIKVHDPDEDSDVNITLPISFVNLGMKLAYKFSPELKETGLDESDFKDIYEAIKNGAEGKLVDIKGEDGEVVEITVE